MYINVVYPDNIPFRYIKWKSKRYFSETDYCHRNGVFMHTEKDSFVSLDKNTIHIRVSIDDSASQEIVNDYLKTLFRNKIVGIRGTSENNNTVLKSLNYVEI